MAEENKPEEKPEEKVEEKPEEKAPKAKQEKTPEPVSPLEQARALDKSIKKGNEDYKALIDRQEKVLADARVEGRAFAGGTQQPKFTDKEKASRKRIKAVADASGAEWGKDYE